MMDLNQAAATITMVERRDVVHNVELSTERAVSVPSRKAFLDALRVLACLCVVVLHTSAPVQNFVAGVNSRQWWVADVLISASRWSVPLFVMISGALILGYRDRYSTRTFFLKRFSKVLVPFVAWSAIYIVWQVHLGLQIHSLRDLLPYTIAGPAYYHLWFFYLILGLYLVTPVLSVLVAGASRKLLLFLVALVLINNAVVPLITRFTSIGIYFPTPLATTMLDYFILGWLLKEVALGRVARALIYVLGVGSVVVAVVATQQLTATEGHLDLFFSNYDSLTVFLPTVAVFTFFQSINWERLLRRSAVRKVIGSLATASLGIYLIQLIILYYLTKYTSATLLPTNSLRYLFLSPLIVYGVSAVIVVTLQRLPILSWLVP